MSAAKLAVTTAYAQFTPLARLCRIRRCELSRPDTCVLRRSASGGRTAPPDTDQTQNSPSGGQAVSSHRHTRHDKTVLSCLAWRCELALSSRPCDDAAVSLSLTRSLRPSDSSALTDLTYRFSCSSFFTAFRPVRPPRDHPATCSSVPHVHRAIN